MSEKRLEKPRAKNWGGRSVRLTRNGLLFAAGLLGIAHETLTVSTERPQLLLLFAAMVGLPAFLTHDEKKNESEET